jgi:Zn-dependent protease
MEQIATIIALIISIILHEMAHGYAANALGDPTARLQGRLSPNPLVHIDPLGSVLIPALLLLSNASFLFGWAKPVPYNPYNLSNQKWGEALVALAGPAANVVLAIIFAVIVRLAPVLELSHAFVQMAYYIVFINILLALFNLVPLPPLDGSKILKALLPYRAAQSYQAFLFKIEGFGLFATFAIVFIFINLFWGPFSQVVSTIVGVLTGV